MSKNILVVGSLNADLVVKSPRFPQPGETISGDDLQIIPGGKGANQAVAAAKLGAQVAMIGRVGSDSFASFLVENLNANQVDTSHVLKTDSATGTAIIVVDAHGQNSIVLSPGANGKVSPADVDPASFFNLKPASAPVRDPHTDSSPRRATSPRQWVNRHSQPRACQTAPR